MRRPRLLDLFCGAGGAAMGYHRAGFDVTGVDVVDQPRYPFAFIRADAMRFPLAGFDAIHASPPCQAYSSLRTLRPDIERADLVAATRRRLVRNGRPWVIENVPGAPLRDPTILCGAAFGLHVTTRDGADRWLRRHRLFESDGQVPAVDCACRGRLIVGVYGNGGGQNTRGYQAHATDARRLLDTPWMTLREMSQSIPPAYTEHVGRWLIARL